MDDSEKLRELLHELERTHSPLQRLRLVALAWRTIRGLSPGERENLAMRIGLGEAGGLVERLAAREGGMAPTELLEAIHAAETTDPGKLRRLLADAKGVVKDPTQRRQLLDRAAQALNAGLKQAPPPPAPATTPPPPATAGPAAGPGAAPPVTEPPPRPVVEPAPPPPQPKPGPTEPPARPLPPPGAKPTPPPPAAPAPAPATPRARPPEPAAAPGGIDAFLAPLPGRRALLSRLVALRRNAVALSGGSRAELGQALEAFPAGWPRRRALCSLLEQGVPAATDAALELVASLEGERNRAWCLATLLRTRQVSDRQLDEAVQLVASPAGRGRLRRLARSGR